MNEEFGQLNLVIVLIGLGASFHIYCLVKFFELCSDVKSLKKQLLETKTQRPASARSE